MNAKSGADRENCDEKGHGHYSDVLRAPSNHRTPHIVKMRHFLFASTPLLCYNESMDKKLEDQMVQLYDEGKLLKEIAAITGRSEGCISQTLQKYGRSAWDRRYPDAPSWNDDEIIADYQNYMPTEEIFAKHKIAATTFYRLLKESKTPLRPRRGTIGKANYQYKHGNGSRANERTPQLTKQVAAVCLGYVVPRGWIIHHMDENPGNNHPENLAIFHTKKEHAIFHQQQLHCQREGLPYDANQLASESGGFLLPLPTHPILLPHEKDRLDPPKVRQKPKTDHAKSEPK